jgi:hypothetical protein
LAAVGTTSGTHERKKILISMYQPGEVLGRQRTAVCGMAARETAHCAAPLTATCSYIQQSVRSDIQCKLMQTRSRRFNAGPPCLQAALHRSTLSLNGRGKHSQSDRQVALPTGCSCFPDGTPRKGWYNTTVHSVTGGMPAPSRKISRTTIPRISDGRVPWCHTSLCTLTVPSGLPQGTQQTLALRVCCFPDLYSDGQWLDGPLNLLLILFNPVEQRLL